MGREAAGALKEVEGRGQRSWAAVGAVRAEQAASRSRRWTGWMVGGQRQDATLEGVRRDRPARGQSRGWEVRAAAMVQGEMRLA